MAVASDRPENPPLATGVVRPRTAKVLRTANSAEQRSNGRMVAARRPIGAIYAICSTSPGQAMA